MKARKPLCLVPARGGSKRLPRKNVALLGGRPMLAWTVECARNSGLFDVVWVSSEDPDILAAAVDCGAQPLPRDPGLGGDEVTLQTLCHRVVPPLAAAHGYTDLYLLLPTSPLRRATSIRAAWQAYLESGADTLLSLAPAPHPPHWALTAHGDRIVPMFPEHYLTVRQELPRAYYHDGGHLLVRISALLRTGLLVNEECAPFFPPADEGIDVNEPEDLRHAEFLLASRKEDSL